MKDIKLTLTWDNGNAGYFEIKTVDYQRECEWDLEDPRRLRPVTFKLDKLDAYKDHIVHGIIESMYMTDIWIPIMSDHPERVTVTVEHIANKQIERPVTNPELAKISSEELDPECVRIINKHFWDLF